MRITNMLMSVVVAALICVASCSSCEKKKDSFILSSGDIEAGGVVPQNLAHLMCSGENISPGLKWDNPPGKTKSYAITLIDKNAFGWIHWIMYNISADKKVLKPGEITGGADVVMNSFGETGYGGPCPPAGSTHTYQFKVWALDVENTSEIRDFLSNGNGTFINSLGNHVLDSAAFDATYTHSSK